MADPSRGSREIRHALDNDRADRIQHLLAECHREIKDADELDTWEMGDLGLLIDAAKDEINRRRAPDD